MSTDFLLFLYLFFQIHITVLNTKLQCRLMVIHIDIYMNNHQAALQFGVQYSDVYLKK